MVKIFRRISLFKQNSHDGGLPKGNWATTYIPLQAMCPMILHSKAKSNCKLSSIKNPRDMHKHNSLSNVAIHMPFVKIHLTVCILHTYLRLQWVMVLTALSCFCSKIERYIYVAKSHLISNTCTVISI